MLTVDWSVAATAALGVHAGFQLTVSGLVYPALGSLPAGEWVAGHRRHTRRIAPLVGVVYLTVLASLVAAVLAAQADRALLLAGACFAVVLALTAFVAGPLHGRLGDPRNPRLYRRLLRADRWRSVFAVLALVAAAVGAG